MPRAVYGPGSPPAAPLATGRPETYRVSPAITFIRASDMPTSSAVTYRPPSESTARPHAVNFAARIVSPGPAASTTHLPTPRARPALASLHLLPPATRPPQALCASPHSQLPHPPPP